MLLVFVAYYLFLGLFFLVWGWPGPPISETVIFWLWMAVNVTDAHSTYLFLKKGDIEDEGNGLFRWLFKKIGILPGLLIKLIIATIFGLVFWSLKNSMLASIIVIAAVSLSNYKKAKDQTD